MSELPYLTPFDILVKNFFNTNEDFLPAIDAKPYHPVDIYEDTEGLHLEVACTGLDKKDVEVQIEGDILKIKHTKSKDTKTKGEDSHYYTKGISRKSFNLGYKVASRFKTPDAIATFKNGLLVIDIPFAEESKPKTLTIK